jgi:hypothetical protein
MNFGGKMKTLNFAPHITKKGFEAKDGCGKEERE